MFEPEFSASLVYDPTEIILICLFGAPEIFLTIINVKSSCAPIFCGKSDVFFSFDKKRK